jgi:hypothetical protein
MDSGLLPSALVLATAFTYKAAQLEVGLMLQVG